VGSGPNAAASARGAAAAAPAVEAGALHVGAESPSAARASLDAGWLADLRDIARARLDAGEPAVWDELTRLFEGCLITTALEVTHGRRIEAAQKLGIGRNTITRKIKDLGLEG
jgi:two-component system nitrogen regulation response regulator GlnG